MSWTLVLDSGEGSAAPALIDARGPAAGAWRRASRAVPEHVLLEMYAFELVERQRAAADDGDPRRRWSVPFWPGTAVAAAAYDVDRTADLATLLPAGTAIEGAEQEASAIDAAQIEWFGRRLFDAQRYVELLADRPAAVGAWPRPTHATVGAFLRRGDEVLLERRPDDATVYPGQWDWPGGHLERGETPEQTLTREFEEELGVSPSDPQLIAHFEHRDPASGRFYEHIVFAAEAYRGELQPREGQQLGWFTVDRALRLPDLGPCVPSALARLVGAR